MFRALGIAAGTVSLTILAWKGFHFTFGPFLLAVLEELEKDYSLFFGIFEPPIKQALAILNTYVGWDLQLEPHWKHVFALNWVYFSANGRTDVRYRQYWSDAIASYVEGFLIALVVGVLSGVAALDGANLAIAFWPIVGFILYHLSFQTSGAGVRGFLWRYALPCAVALAIASQADKIPYLQTLPSPGLALLFVLLMARAIKAVSPLVLNPKRYDVREADVGIDMMGVIGGAGLVVLLGMAGI